MSSPAARRAINANVAIIIPVILLAASVFATWALTARLAVDYLLRPSPERQSFNIPVRTGAGAACITVYYILLLLMWLPYFRSLHTMYIGAGLVPQGPESADRCNETVELSKYHSMKAFTVVHDGFLRPKWCDACKNWKPDRAHHCSEMERCVRRMDHFCPWMGGVVSEANHKFFMQFLFWGMIYTWYLIAWFAFAISESRQKTGGFDKVFAAILGIGGFFGLFLTSMFFTSFHLLLLNRTTIENINAKTATHWVAIATKRAKRDNLVSMPDNLNFFIIQTAPGEHPWHLGYAENFRQVMGRSPVEWFLPVGISPSIRERGETEFAFGAGVTALYESQNEK